MKNFVLGMIFVGGLTLLGHGAYELGKLHQKEIERKRWIKFADAIIKMSENEEEDEG